MMSFSTLPSVTSTVIYLAIIVCVLFASEFSLRFLLAAIVDNLHPMFQSEHNRKVLARHIGVDFVSCASVSYLGISGRKYLSQIRSRFWDSSATFTPAYSNRMWTYIPVAYKCLLIFTGYQIKNLYDSFVWDDGIEFIIHHVLAGTAAWGAMYPGCGHTYALFYMGISEVSTTVLVILANFDEVHGVAGLAEAFPNLKIVCAVSFVAAFLTCRIIMWPWVTKFYLQDTRDAMNADDKKTKERKIWLLTFGFILSALTLLQFLWLGQIFMMAKEEIGKMLAE